MTRYIARRLVAYVPTLFAVAVLVFLMIELVPGDPVILMLGLESDDEAIAAMRSELGLDLPLAQRMVKWFGNALTGDQGESYFLKQPMTEALASRYPVTLSIAVFAALVSIAVGIPAGIIASVYQGRVADWLAMVLALIVLSLPSFWLALNLIVLLGVKWRLFPVGGYVPFSEDPVAWFMHLFLPSVSLGLAYAAAIARIARTSMLEVLRLDYVRVARAKGLRERLVIFRHAFRNALIPVLTVIGINFGGLLGGAAVTETVFTIPGVGRLIVEGVQRRDYPVIQAGLLALTVTFLTVNLLVDVLYVFVDPRIQYQ
jgi:peptide/nickel transport system permease protein